MTTQSKLSAWISASRPHTLPLSVGGIIIGNATAFYTGAFEPCIAFLALLTAILFQIISNFANDYGDYVHGADNEERTGPERMVQSGRILPNQVKTAITITTILSLISASLLLIISFENIGITGIVILFLLGLLSVAAAITYTATSLRYGYRGMGDPAVFLFFGLLSTAGSFYLHTGFVNLLVFFPGVTFGLFVTAVLNINNLRDIENDRKSGKNTIPVILGFTGGKRYHLVLLLTGVVLSAGFNLIVFPLYSAITGMLILIPVLMNAYQVSTEDSPARLAPRLKQLVIATLIYAAGTSALLIIQV